MSGTSDTTKCPRCGREHFDVYTDWKPWDTISGNCLDCGFILRTDTGLMDEDELKDTRIDFGFEFKDFTEDEKKGIKEFDSEYGLERETQKRLE